jgi:uncharacterized membrane protein YbhN (UPF0104 family)
MSNPHFSPKSVAMRVASVGAVGAAVLLLLVVPRAVGMSWHDVVAILAGLPMTALAALTGLWLLGLWIHTYVLTAALPGLSKRRALLLNLSGSAVSNLLPFGGAAGIGVGFVMARSWRIAPANFASFTAISNFWNVIGKLFVGSALVAGAVAAGIHVPTSMRSALIYGSGGVLAASVIGVAALSTPVVGRSLGRAWDRAANGLLVRLGMTCRVHAEGAINRFRKTCTESITAGWCQLTMGVLAYLGLQAALLAACLLAVGAHASVLVIAAAFGVERILSLFPFTPGGAGIAELGSVAVLVALGGDPALMAAGVLLYRTFTFLLEIPVGGVSAIAWLLFRTQSASRTGTTA